MMFEGKPALSAIAFTAVVFLFVLAAPASADARQDVSTAMSDTISAGRFDNGKMWAFEYPPLDYLEETYGFTPDEDWFERARLSSLRIPGCSASFVSPHGLVVTNHHCVRGQLPSISEPGESLLDEGFYARTLEEERRIPGYYADQLIAIEDVSDEVDAALAGAENEEERVTRRREVFAAITARIQSERSAVVDLRVQVIPLYSGGRHSAYVFRRYSDVRMVFAVELNLGFFGGDGDNFTYPRYALDFSFLRIYGEDGRPLESPFHFGFSDAGIEEGDLIFVIGNPGSTSRQATVSQLEFHRDVLVDHTFRTLDRRLEAFRAFYAENPEAGEEMNLRNTIFSISNSEKAYAGRDAALKSEWLIPRRASAERALQEAIEADPDLSNRFGSVFDDMAAIQDARREFDAEHGAFQYIQSGAFASATMRRAIAAVAYIRAATVEEADRAREALLQIPDLPPDLERRLLRLRLEEFQMYFGPADPVVAAALDGQTSEVRASSILDSSTLATRARLQTVVEQDRIGPLDPAVAIADAFYDRYIAFREAYESLDVEEAELERLIGRARFDVYGVQVPSDATFSPRFTDGVVRGYEYNGTLAPPYTTLFGLLDHYYSYGGHPDWTLPQRWRNLPADVDLGTPLNFISTSDTIGGNSGSPAVTPELALVGLNFDRNIEGLSRDYIYLAEEGRNIMVDMRSVKETLDKVYDGDRIVLELTTGTMASSEEEADAIQAGAN